MSKKQTVRDQLREAVGITDDIDKRKVDTYFTSLNNKNKSTYDVFLPNTVFQADLMEMPKRDKRFKYIFTIVDVVTNEIDAEPQVSKTARATTRSIMRIFERAYIQPEDIKFLYVDSGSEFGAEFKNYLRKHNIILRVTRVARKNQNAKVENINGVIRTTINERINLSKLKGKVDNRWADYIPKIVSVYNKTRREKYKEKKIEHFFNSAIINGVLTKKMLVAGDKVLIPLERSEDAFTGKRRNSRKRAGDFKFSTKEYTISKVSFYPNQPPRYMVEEIKNVSYLRNELKLVDHE